MAIHPTQTFPGFLGDLHHFPRKFAALLFQDCLTCSSAQFASNFCFEQLLPCVWTCMRACSGSRSYRLHQCPAGWALMGWHPQCVCQVVSTLEWRRNLPCRDICLWDQKHWNPRRLSNPPTECLRGINNTHTLLHTYLLTITTSEVFIQTSDDKWW